MNTLEGTILEGMPLDKLRLLIKEAIILTEAKLGTSVYEYIAMTVRPPTRAVWKSFRIQQPYCFTKLAGGRWLPLNRLYKPLGVASRAWIDYEQFAHQAARPPTDPREISDVWVCKSETHLWLYSDDPRTLRTYYKRFARLAAATCPWRVSK